mmetsp:Transcript_24297/g.61688  ORF Transcript_24297/g.61688 Transcript_24297/m.61688 type:complete len:205 (-) Transcript_24297:829-1443(-)
MAKSASVASTPLGKCLMSRFLACAARMRARSSTMIFMRASSASSCCSCSSVSCMRSSSNLARRSSSSRSISLRCSICLRRRFCSLSWSRRSSSANLSSIERRNRSSSAFSSSRLIALSWRWYSLASAMSALFLAARSAFSRSLMMMRSSVSWMTSSLRRFSISSASSCRFAMSAESFSRIASLAFWSFSVAIRAAVSRSITRFA